jgi:hypothetical protein
MPTNSDRPGADLLCRPDKMKSCAEEQVIVLVERSTIRKAEWLIESCEACNKKGAEIPFDAILDRIAASDPSVTDYILERPAKCPNCGREITEKALGEPA